MTADLAAGERVRMHVHVGDAFFDSFEQLVELAGRDPLTSRADGLPKEVVERWTEALAQLARDPGWLAGNEKLGGIPAIRSPQETERFVREQYQLYEKLAIRLGLRS